MADLERLTVADRIASTLVGLGRAVAARISPRGAVPPMQAAMIVLVWTRLKRVERQILGLLARFAAGRLVVAAAPRVTEGAAGRRRVVSARLPCRFGWLLGMVPFEAACFAGQLRAELAEPEMVALLAASPQARRVLGPVCRMLAIERSVLGVPEKVPARGADEGVPVAKPRVRVVREKVDFGRIPLPRGVLAAAKRQGFGKR